MRFKYGLKAQKLIAQGNGRKQHALKGQKLLAQGSALGIMAISKAPCKGKSFENCLILVKLLPLQVGCSKLESKIRYKKRCYFGAAKLLIFNTLIYEIVL